MSTPGPPVLSNAPLSSSQRLEFLWLPPLTDGGSPVTNYRIKLCNADTGTILPSNTTYFNTGATLINGTTYFATIEACNANGFGQAASFRPFQPGTTAPNAPSTISTTALTANGGSTNSVLVSWTPPSSLPDSTIFWYALYVTSSDPTEPERTFTANGLRQSNYIVRNLFDARTYTFRLSAVNCPGYSPFVSTTAFIQSVDYFVPNDIQGLNLWLDGADSTTLTLSGSNVTQWNDKSGYGLNTNTKFGTIALSNNSLNGCNALYFANDASFRGPMSYTGSQFTSFAVYRFLSINDNRRILSLGSSSQNDFGNTLYTYMGLAARAFGFFRNLATLATMGTATTGVNYLQTGGFSGSSNYSAINGSNPNFVASSGNFSFTNYAISANVGSSTDGPAEKIMGEVLLYRTDLPTFYRQQNEGYLAWKWGLQSNLPSDHPYRNTQPLNPGLISPYEAPNLSFWLDATRIAAVSSGTALTRWNDVSSNAFVGTGSNKPGTAGNNPVYQSSIFNGYMPAVVFESAKQNYVDFGNVLNLRTSSISIYAVTQSSNNDGGIIGKSLPSGGSSRWSLVNDTTYSVGTNMLVDYGTTVTARTAIVTTPSLLNGNWDRTQVNLYRNGSFMQSNAAVSSVDFNTAYSLFVGAYQNTATTPLDGYFFNGTMGEILVFMSTPIESTRQKIEGYLSWKWGLTANLPNQHPYKFYPPLSNYSSIAINTSTVFATNFNNGNDIGFTNFSNTNLISSQTITGSGAAYNTNTPAGTLSQYPRYAFTSLTASAMTICASVYLLSSSTYRGIIYSPVVGIAIGGTTNSFAYLWNSAFYDSASYGTLSLNTWNHIALTVSPTEARFYINGSNVGIRTAAHTTSVISSITIGTDPVTPTNFFPGYIDNVRFYTSTLTSNEIQAIYYNTQFI